MRPRTRLLLLKVAVVVLPLGLIVAAMHWLLPGLARHREQQLLGETYVLKETDRFRIWRPRDVALEPLVASGLELFLAQLYAQYGEALDLRPLEDEVKITVHVFASHDDLVRYASRRMKQDLSHAEGFYDPVSWGIALTLRPPRELLRTLFHEATHLLMDRSAPEARWSLWFSEGMAVYFESSAVAEGRLVLGGADRGAAARVLELAARGAHVPLERLVDGDEELFRSQAAALAYQEAGLLVAFLLDGAGGRHRQKFLRYYRVESHRGAPPPDALATYLDLSMERLEDEWLAYLRTVVR
ncbi:MAG: DUF1570 domain-containing protein [Candidatus Brocadiia bacterium]